MECVLLLCRYWVNRIAQCFIIWQINEEDNSDAFRIGSKSITNINFPYLILHAIFIARINSHKHAKQDLKSPSFALSPLTRDVNAFK